HHIKAFATDPRNTLLFVGYQAPGTRGATIVAGVPTVRMHGTDVPVRAEVANLDGLSAHADYREILDWLGGFEVAPKHTFVTHGEPQATRALAARIQRELGWRSSVPSHLSRVSLDSAS